MVHCNRTLGDRQSQTGSPDFLGMGLVHTIETLKDSLYTVLRDSHTGIRHCYIEIFMVCIQRHTHPSIIHIIFNAILHQIADSKSKLHLIHICIHRAEAIQDQIDIAPVCNGTQALEDILQKLIDIHMGDVYICCFLIHLYQ